MPHKTDLELARNVASGHWNVLLTKTSKERQPDGKKTLTTLPYPYFVSHKRHPCVDVCFMGANLFYFLPAALTKCALAT